MATDVPKSIAADLNEHDVRFSLTSGHPSAVAGTQSDNQDTFMLPPQLAVQCRPDAKCT